MHKRAFYHDNIDLCFIMSVRTGFMSKTCAEQEHSPETANMTFLKDRKVKFLSSSLKAKSYSLYQ